MTHQAQQRLILGSRVDATSYTAAAQQIVRWAAAGEGRSVCICNVHMIMEAHDDLRFLEIINHADLVTPDGMPVVWALKLLGVKNATRVDGAGLIASLLTEAAKTKVPVALYGGTERSAAGFAEFARRHYGVELAASIQPPFRPLTEAEDAADTHQLVAAGARVVLVAMGCPKQERWMAAHRNRLPAVLIGVGAAIDFHAGVVRRAPRWMQRSGLEWFFRFCQEPRRLWRRYLYHNPRFLYRLSRQLLAGGARQTPAPVWRYPRSFAIYVRHLRPAQWLTTDQLRTRQQTQLRLLLREAAQHVPYYRNLFAQLGATPDDFRELTDLHRLPILHKDQVRENPFLFLHDRTHPRRLLKDRTSGSTGQPFTFYLTPQQKAWDLACAIRFWHWIGYRTGHRVAAFRHYQPPTTAAPPTHYERRSNTLFFSVYDMTPANLRRYVAEFNQFRPQFVRGYPSSIYSFAQFAAVEGLPLHAPRAVLTSSETLSDEMRTLIERALHCPVYDWWGSNERLVTACQCEQRGPYHINAETGLLELLPDQPDGKPGGSGLPTSGSGLLPATGAASPADRVQKGAPTEPAPPALHRLVATGLLNHAMPLIRYDLGDLAVPATAPCPCGRGLPVLDRILGRVNDLILTGNSKRVPPVRFYTLFENHLDVRQFQVVQTAPDHVLVRLVCPQPLAPANQQTLRAQLTRFLGDDVAVEFAFVDAIAPEPSGKIRNVISLVQP